MRSVFLLVLLTTTPVLAQQPEGRGHVHASVGYFDGTGVYGDDVALTLSNRSAELGAEVHVLRRTALVGTLGTTFRMAAAEAGIGADDPDPFTSGFRPQHLALFARLANEVATATAGFVLDLGPDPFNINLDAEPDAPFHFFNSDVQNAVHLGLSSEAPMGPANLHGSLDGFLTLPHVYTSTFRDIPTFPETEGDLITIEGEIDFGDQYILRIGGGYTAGLAEFGLDLAYAVTTDGEDVRSASELPVGEIREPIAARSLLSLIPYVTVASAGSPFEVRLAAEAPGGAYNDHTPYGITVTGENQTKVRMPVSLRVRYGF